MTRVLSLADAFDRRLAAVATARGAALLYGFANFRALAALPSRASRSVTSDLSRTRLPFDWARLPRGLTPATVAAVMDDFHSIGPIGFRGPAASWVPDHLTVRDGGVRTVQHVSPGVRCRSNVLIGEILDRTGEDVLAHFARVRIPDHGPGIVRIADAEETTARAAYRQHLPCSPTIVSFHRRFAHPALVLERVGSLSAEDVRTVVARHDLDLVVAGPG